MKELDGAWVCGHCGEREFINTNVMEPWGDEKSKLYKFFNSPCRHTIISRCFHCRERFDAVVAITTDK